MSLLLVLVLLLMLEEVEVAVLSEAFTVGTVSRTCTHTTHHKDRDNNSKLLHLPCAPLGSA